MRFGRNPRELDCDDENPLLRDNFNDCDEDGLSVDLDCNDRDATDNDGDCDDDGFITAEDCDDSNPLLGGDFSDCDDGIENDIDCNDRNVDIGTTGATGQLGKLFGNKLSLF